MIRWHTHTHARTRTHCWIQVFLSLSLSISLSSYLACICIMHVDLNKGGCHHGILSSFWCRVRGGTSPAVSYHTLVVNAGDTSAAASVAQFRQIVVMNGKRIYPEYLLAYRRVLEWPWKWYELMKRDLFLQGTKKCRDWKTIDFERPCVNAVFRDHFQWFTWLMNRWHNILHASWNCQEEHSLCTRRRAKFAGLQYLHEFSYNRSWCIACRAIALYWCLLHRAQLAGWRRHCETVFCALNSSHPCFKPSLLSCWSTSIANAVGRNRPKVDFSRAKSLRQKRDLGFPSYLEVSNSTCRLGILIDILGHNRL